MTYERPSVAMIVLSVRKSSKQTRKGKINPISKGKGKSPQDISKKGEIMSLPIPPIENSSVFPLLQIGNIPLN